jgi:hypothetical protein
MASIASGKKRRMQVWLGAAILAVAAPVGLRRPLRIREAFV